MAGQEPDDTLNVFTFALGGASIFAPPSGAGGTYSDFCLPPDLTVLFELDPPPLGEAINFLKKPIPPSFLGYSRVWGLTSFSLAGFGDFGLFSSLGFEDSDQHA